MPKGLDSFDEADTELFFGRETPVGELGRRAVWLQRAVSRHLQAEGD